MLIQFGIKLPGMSNSAYLTESNKKISRWMFRTISVRFSARLGCCWRR